MSNYRYNEVKKKLCGLYGIKNAIFVCQGANPGVVRMDSYEASDIGADD